MEPTIAKDVLDRLVALGRRQGHLTTEEVRHALPVDAMSPDEIALVVVHLEDQGIPVELEESLLAPHPGPRSSPNDEPALVLRPEQDADWSVRGTPPPTQALANTGADATPPTPPPPRAMRAVHWAVALAGVVLLLVVVVVLAG
jgi:hypothetical protein